MPTLLLVYNQFKVRRHICILIATKTFFIFLFMSFDIFWFVINYRQQHKSNRKNVLSCKMKRCQHKAHIEEVAS